MEYQTILFKKNPVLFKDEAEALNALRSMKFTMGEPVVAIYGPSWKEAELILAIGKRTAAGETAFDIVATSKDTANINVDIVNIKNALSVHEGTLASDDNPGHVVSGRYIGYINGYGFIKQLSHKIDFVSEDGTVSFNGSEDVSVNIPAAGNSGPKANSSIGSAGSSLNYSREDHVHPIQQTISGNAGSATKLQTPKRIDITGAVLGNATTDFSDPVTIKTSVNHTHPSSDITDIDDILDDIKSKAPINSPKLTGVPTAPTAGRGTNTSQIATTQFVINEIQNKIESATALRYKGTIGTGDDDTVATLPAEHVTGDTYLCNSGSPRIGGYKTEPGDMIICIRDSNVASDSDWSIIQGNIDGSLVIGEGLTGSGNLKSGATVSHYPKPTSGTKEGENGASFVTGIYVDKFGHISGVEKSNISNRLTAGVGRYISEVWIDKTGLVGNFGDIPTIQINNGDSVQDQYITGLSVSTNNNSHTINVTKRSLTIPDINIRYADDVPGQYVSGFTSIDQTINVLRKNFPEESGKIKLSENDEAEYLGSKLTSDETTGNKYGVNITPSSDSLRLGVTIEEIDGNKEQSIRVKRGNIPGDDGEDMSLEEGELFANTSDLFLYINTGDSGIKRLYPLATSSSPGLMSPEDKEKLDKASTDIGDVGNISLILSALEQRLTEKINNNSTSINNLDQKITEENTERVNKDTELENSIKNLDDDIVKEIQLGTSSDSIIVSATNGRVTLPQATQTSPGIITSEDWIYLNETLPGNINSFIDRINNYTVNGIKISENPSVNGNNSQLTGYQENTSGEWPSGGDSINTGIAKLEYQLKQEIDDRTSKDDEFKIKLNDEISAREISVTTLSNTLSNEIIERNEAINSLKNEINNNIQGQINSLRDEINNYITPQINQLQTNLNEEINNRTEAITNLRNEFNSDINILRGETTTKINQVQSDLNKEITNRTEAINDLRDEINNNIQGQIDALRDEINNNISVKIQELQETIDGLLTGDGLSDDLQGTHYLSGAKNLIEALKALDNKIYNIEQSMLSSVRVKDAG